MALIMLYVISAAKRQLKIEIVYEYKIDRSHILKIQKNERYKRNDGNFTYSNIIM